MYGNKASGNIKLQMKTRKIGYLFCQDTKRFTLEKCRVSRFSLRCLCTDVVRFYKTCKVLQYYCIGCRIPEGHCPKWSRMSQRELA